MEFRINNKIKIRMMNFTIYCVILFIFSNSVIKICILVQILKFKKMRPYQKRLSNSNLNHKCSWNNTCNNQIHKFKDNNKLDVDKQHLWMSNQDHLFRFTILAHKIYPTSEINAKIGISFLYQHIIRKILS